MCCTKHNMDMTWTSYGIISNRHQQHNILLINFDNTGHGALREATWYYGDHVEL